MTKPEKNFDTGLRILEVLKILQEKDMSKNDIINELKNNNLFESVYTQEAFIKYFNIFELFGLIIEKEKNVYKLKNSLLKVTLSKNEIEVLIDLIKYIRKLHNKKIESELKGLLYKFIKYTDANTQEVILKALQEADYNMNGNNNTIGFLEKLLYDNQLVTITFYKNKSVQESITVIIKEIIEKNNDIVIVCYDSSKSRNKKIYLSSIISIKQSPQKASNSQYLNSVVFRLYGRLASLYKLKTSETVLDFSKDCITVSNTEEDKDILLRRLLKYGESCKIIKPQIMKDEFISLTKDILKNLQEDKIG